MPISHIKYTAQHSHNQSEGARTVKQDKTGTAAQN